MQLPYKLCPVSRLRQRDSLPEKIHHSHDKEADESLSWGTLHCFPGNSFWRYPTPDTVQILFVPPTQLLRFLKVNFIQLGREHQAAKLCNMHHLPKNSSEKLKLKRFMLNSDLTFYHKENIILSGVIDFFCLKTEQFFEASMLCGIVNEMRSLSSSSYCSSDVKVDSWSWELLPSEQPFCKLIISIPALGNNPLHDNMK